MLNRIGNKLYHQAFHTFHYFDKLNKKGKKDITRYQTNTSNIMKSM
ncbi:LOW QUALITY PROTEIN: hypothetical protein TorRG33x02_266380 [Trema orientale]|uniref:Uncharacterized protein n=1 Tax=Trema orientale TaxID=63057 RepID=A0A2P5D0X5_TREOI|nr:LOW QUALITY PROTEIN: hypothetical protein TorRG33x02_266380 [Trema orientale]